MKPAHALHRAPRRGGRIDVLAAIALVRLTMGVYGLLAFTSAQRLPELGVRLALGATRRQIRALMLARRCS